MLALSSTPCWILTGTAIEFAVDGELHIVGARVFFGAKIERKKKKKFPPVFLPFFGSGVLFVLVTTSVLLSVPVLVSSLALAAVTVSAPAAGSAMTGTRPTHTITAHHEAFYFSYTPVCSR